MNTLYNLVTHNNLSPHFPPMSLSPRALEEDTLFIKSPS